VLTTDISVGTSRFRSFQDRHDGALDIYLQLKYLEIKINGTVTQRERRMVKLESLSGGSGVHVFLVLWKAARAVESYAEKSITDLQMCGSDFAVLEALLHKGPLPVNEIGKKILLTSGSITVAIDRLEKRGLVERRAHGTDRRARIVHLTKEGRKLITGIYAEHAADMENLAAASLTKAERKTLISLLKKIGYQAAAQSEEGAA
jgi:MarR family transcriptional regulator, 2-MHQ and catechol-resistance regulon repressor